MSEHKPTGQLSDLAFTDYAVLLDMIRADLNLDASYGILPKSILPDNVAPQVPGQLAQGANLVPSGVFSTINNWTTANTVMTAGTYMLANTNGFTILRAGIYLVTGRFRWDIGAAGTYRATYLTKNGVQTQKEVVTAPINTIGPGHDITDIMTCGAGDTLTLGLLHNAGAGVASQASALSALWLSNIS